MTTEVIPHGQAFCLVRNRPIPKQDRLAGATCPFCTVQLPPKNRKMLVTVDEEDNVISSSIRFNRPRLGRGVSVVERCERTVMSDQFDGLGLPGRFVATHPRRVRWHSRHGDPDGVRSLLKQGNQRPYRDMTLHNVAIDQSGMTRDRVERNTDLCLERGETPVFLHLDVRSVVL